MALATGGSAVGLTRMRSRPNSCALRTAAGVGMISTEPSGNTALTSRARIASLTFSRTRGRRGAKFLGGSIDQERNGFTEAIPVIVKSYQIRQRPGYPRKRV